MSNQRLNGVIKQLEQGKPAFTSFVLPEIENAVFQAQSKNDGVVFEMEHNPWDITNLRVAMQFMVMRQQIASDASIAPRVTPMVRIPPSGDEFNQFFAKQALDLGAYGIVWPRISTPEQAYNAVAACRYPNLPNHERYEPRGLRGDAPMAAARYWGLGQQDYYKKADVWGVDPDGELLVIFMLEDVKGMENLEEILKTVQGVGVVLVGEGDLTQELGCPREYDNPELLRYMQHTLDVCKGYNVAVGHPHVYKNNVASILEQGYRFLMHYPQRDMSALNEGLRLTGRAE